MAKTVTINVPAMARDGKKLTVEAKGYVANLMVGGQKVRFLIQTEAATKTGNRVHLVHYASGLQLVDISTMRLGYMAARGPQNTPMDRAIAQRYLEDLVAQHGAEAVIGRLRAAEVINP